MLDRRRLEHRHIHRPERARHERSQVGNPEPLDDGLILLSTKRSSHHAFLEGLLSGRRYQYDNNMIWRDGALTAKTPTRSDGVDPPEFYVASFEQRYALPGLYARPQYQRLEQRAAANRTLRRVIFLRDPINTAASTYSAHLKHPNVFRSFDYVRKNLRLWLNLAQYVRAPQREEIFIYANSFWADAAYRARSLQALGAADARYTTKLSRFGGGGNTFLQERTQAVTAEALTSRYQHYRSDEVFVSLMREPDFQRGASAFFDLAGDSAMKDVLTAF